MIGALATIALFAFVGVRALYIGLWAERLGSSSPPMSPGAWRSSGSVSS